MAHMTWEQAFDYAYRMARLSGRRYRVYKSKSAVPWWNTYLVPNR